MRRFSFLLFLFLGIIIGHAKEIHLTTNLPEASYVTVPFDYDTKRCSWSNDGTMDLSLTNKQGINVVVTDESYYLEYVKVDGKAVITIPGTTSTTVTNSVWIDSKELSEGSKIEVKAIAKIKRSVTICADPEKVIVRYNYIEYLPSKWNNGELTIDIKSDSDPITLVAKSGYKMSSIMFNDKEQLPYAKMSFSIVPSMLSRDDNRFEVEFVSLKDQRTSFFNVEINGDVNQVFVSRAGDRPDPIEIPDDDPSCSGSLDPVRPTDFTDVISGEDLNKPISFNPEFDLPIIIASNNSEIPIYKVTFFGEEQVPNESGRYNFYDVENGDVIKVDVEYPNIQIPVRLHFVNEETDRCITSIFNTQYQRIPEEEWQMENWTVQMGTILRIKFNTDDYTVTAKIGETEYPDGDVNFIVLDKDGYDVYITAEPREPYQVTINYEYSPAHFKVYIGSKGDECYEMTGENATDIQVPRNRSLVIIVPDEGWIIKDVYVDGEIAGTEISISDATKNIDVFVDEYIRDQEAIVFMDPDADWTHMTVTLSQGVQSREKIITLENGYNKVNFNEQDLPFNFDILHSRTREFVGYMNGEDLSDLSVVEDVMHGHIMKFFSEEPVEYTVNFEIEEGAPVEIYRDMIEKLDNPAEETVWKGTQFDIIPEDAGAVIVSIGGVDQPRPENDVYQITVNENMAVKIVKGDPTSVVMITESMNNEVYSMQGIRLSENASAETLKRLPSGLYIVNGKKVYLNNK